MLKVIGANRLAQAERLLETLPEALFSEAMWTVENGGRGGRRRMNHLKCRSWMKNTVMGTDVPLGKFFMHWEVFCSPHTLQ